MCEQPGKTTRNWQGWLELPDAEPVAGRGPWVDLSHPLGERMPRVPVVPEPSFTKFRRMPDDPFNVSEMHMVVHLGTHVDAPYHFIDDGPAMEGVPLERLSGAGVVWRIEAEPLQAIGPEVLERMEPRAQPGDIVMLDTGWSDQVGTERYERHPHLTAQAAEWLLEQRIKLLAVDFGTPEAAPEERWDGWHWPVHHTLLPYGVLIAEHLCRPRPLAGQRVEAMFLPLNLEGGDGAPARVVARTL